MLTVKHIVRNDGTDIETLYTARRVVSRTDPYSRTVRLFGVDGDPSSELLLDEHMSDVFVMNDKGSTISRYSLISPDHA